MFQRHSLLNKMRNLINIKRAVLEIANLLAQDEMLCKLLVNDTASAMTDAAPSKTINDLIQENYISIFPPVENRIEEYGRNTFVSILVDNINGDSTTLHTTIVVYVSTNADHILLNNNKNRLLEAVDRINTKLQNQKITAAGKLDITNISHVMLSEFHSGYKINIRFEDQATGNGEI